MTLFLRNDRNTIVDIEVNNGKNGIDIHCSINIERYSYLLLDNFERRSEVIIDFISIQELRQWFWEVYMNSVDKADFNDVITKLKKTLIPIAAKYNLNYVED